jgi:hypothetical protein
MKQADLYFEKHEELVPMAKDFFKRIFIFTGVEDIDDYTMKRCINELGNFVTKADQKTKTVRAVRKDTDIVFVSKKEKDEFIEKNKQPIYILQPRPERANKESISNFFERYKKEFNLVDKDFGIGSHMRRTARFVYNKAMFSRFASSCGYNVSQIADFFGCDRTTVIHYLRRYKTDVGNEKYATTIDSSLDGGMSETK